MFIKLFAVALPLFLALDFTWLAFIARGYYRSQIGMLLKDDVNFIAAGSFYVIYICGLTTFVLLPALKKKSWHSALFLGAFFGLVTYCTYDLTNLAIAKNWPLAVTIVDIAWGTLLSATVATLTYFIALKFEDLVVERI